MIIICMSYTVIDLVTAPNVESLLANFKCFIKEYCLQDTLYENYANLNITDFVCLTAVLDQGKIIALSGVQEKPNRWGKNTVRMSTRFWMHPKFRISALSKYDPEQRFYFNSQLMIPHQLEFLKKLDVDFAIITREGNYRRSFSKFIELVNYHNKTNFRVLPGIYNVCDHMPVVPESCQQIVAVHSFNGCVFEDELVQLHAANKLNLLSK
jgi:hypothetical protein